MSSHTYDYLDDNLPRMTGSRVQHVISRLQGTTNAVMARISKETVST